MSEIRAERNNGMEPSPAHARMTHFLWQQLPYIIALVLAIFKFANFVMGLVDRERLKNDVRNELIAEQNIIALERTERGKRIMEKVDAMSDDDVDAEFARLARMRGKASGSS